MYENPMRVYLLELINKKRNITIYEENYKKLQNPDYIINQNNINELITFFEEIIFNEDEDTCK